MKNKKFINKKAADKFLSNTKKNLDAKALSKQIKMGNVVALSQAITLCESQKAKDQIIAEEILGKADAYPSHTIRIGITGSPGVGKSTFIESLGLHLLNQGKKVAVLAVDPSSQLTQGSILGDKTRMTLLSKEKKAYIRPSASGKQLGGVAKSTQKSINLCEMAGFDVIIVETVGVGQSEILVHDMTDLFLLLIQPGAGDELQGIKKGIVEMADVIVVNKADGEKQMLAKQARAAYANAIHLLNKRSDEWVVKVMTASAIENKGIEDIWDCIQTFKDHQIQQDLFLQRRKEQNILHFNRSLQSAYLEFLNEQAAIQALTEKLKKEILNGEINPFSASQALIKEIKTLFEL